MMKIPARQDIEAAERRIAPHIRRTGVATSEKLNEMLGASLFFKPENLQVCGVFKPRGASNAVFSLTEDEAKGSVASHSSGNHAQALAYAAKKRGIEAHIVMPANAPKVKVDAVKRHGGKITFCEPTLEARERTLARIVEASGAIFIHPYNNFNVIAGQATGAKELVKDVQELDYIIGPVGGGGLMSGTCLALGYFSPETRALGAEPKGADDAYRSLKAGHIIPMTEPRTIADGLRTSLAPITFEILSRHLEDIITVSEENIVLAMKLIHKELGMVVEPSGAVSLAALLENPERIAGRCVGVIISGGNIDPERYEELTGLRI